MQLPRGHAFSIPKSWRLTRCMPRRVKAIDETGCGTAGGEQDVKAMREAAAKNNGLIREKITRSGPRCNGKGWAASIRLCRRCAMACNGNRGCVTRIVLYSRRGHWRRTMKSMFDIFTTAADGSLHFVESVSCLRKAEDLARRLSSLFPGEYFGCFERSEEAAWPVPRAEGRKCDLPNLGVFPLPFLYRRSNMGAMAVVTWRFSFF